jgi:hypothetical protein
VWSLRLLQWPSFLEHLSWPARVGILVVAALLVLTALSAAMRGLRRPDVTAAATPQEYVRRLTELTRRHRGTIRWVTKTSVWADEAGTNSNGLDVLVRGIRRKRIKQAQYIVHLGYWRRLVSDGDGADAANYRNRLENLLRNVRDYDRCPPEKVVILVGELNEAGPAHRFGLYQRGSRTTLVLGYDFPHASESLPRLFVRDANLIGYHENQFATQWAKYHGQALARITSMDGRGGATDSRHVELRKDLERQLQAELDWISSGGWTSAAGMLPRPPRPE